MSSLGDRVLLTMIVFGLLALTAAQRAGAQTPQALPFSQNDIAVSTANPTFSVNIDMLTAPDRPQLRIFADPDATHPNMTLEAHIDEGAEGCPGVIFGNDCVDFAHGAVPLSWTSNSAPGTVDWEAPIWQCIPAPHDDSVTGGNPVCKVKVTATNFGSGGSPAHFNLHIAGETRPATGVAQTVVSTNGGTASGNLPFDRVPFITDAANFRWIYDAQNDFTVETFQPVSHAQLGVCNINPNDITDPNDIFALPYHYSYVGSPSFVGYDCCTWRMDSVDTGVTDSGQALFYLNKSLANPPPDTDNDGFFDPCDNCVNVPNGPFLGTCVQPNGITNHHPCVSDQQCAGNEFCSMAQEDNDFDPSKGLVCLPEPGATTMLASGVLALAALERRRRRSVSFRASC